MFNLVMRTCWLGLALATSFCPGATLNGTVLDDKGKAVSDAIVTIHRVATNGPLRATESYKTSSAKNGSFSVGDLNAGAFVICATVPKSYLLDPCQWNDSQQIVRLPNPSSNVTATVQLQTGATISLHADDPDGAIGDPTVNNNTLLVMGVWSPQRRFHKAWHSGADATGHNYQIVVAAGVDLEFAVNLINLTCRDDSGALVDANTRTKVHLSVNENLQLHYTANKKP